VVAHELVHAATPSPEPRFYADDRHTPEEATARRAERLTRSLAPVRDAEPAADGARRLTWGTAGLSVAAAGGLLAGGPVRRSMPEAGAGAARAGSAARSSTPRQGSRQSLVDRTAGLFAANRALETASAIAGPPPPTADILRSIALGNTGVVPDPNHPRPGDPPIIRRRLSSSDDQSSGLDVMDVGIEQSSAALTNEQIETIVDAIEQRVMAELERRGRRLDPGVF
jgi:hypothetical protein